MSTSLVSLSAARLLRFVRDEYETTLELAPHPDGWQQHAQGLAQALADALDALDQRRAVARVAPVYRGSGGRDMAWVNKKAADRAHQAKTHMAEANRYTYGPIADVIYLAPGSSADYYYWKKGSLSLGIEMGQDKVPSPSEFPAYFESQEESTWRFLEAI